MKLTLTEHYVHPCWHTVSSEKFNTSRIPYSKVAWLKSLRCSLRQDTSGPPNYFYFFNFFQNAEAFQNQLWTTVVQMGADFVIFVAPVKMCIIFIWIDLVLLSERVSNDSIYVLKMNFMTYFSSWSSSCVVPQQMQMNFQLNHFIQSSVSISRKLWLIILIWILRRLSTLKPN